MYRQVEDFVQDWQQSANGTLSVIQAITDDQLDFSIVEGHNSLAWLAWHLVGAAGAFAHFAGLTVNGIGQENPQAKTVSEIATTYERIANELTEAAKKFIRCVFNRGSFKFCRTN